MTTRAQIEKMITEAVKGSTATRIIEVYLDALDDYEQKESDVLEGLIALYADLGEKDAKIFDEKIDQYYEGSGYSLGGALRDMIMMGASEYMRERIRSLVREKKFEIEGGYDSL